MNLKIATCLSILLKSGSQKIMKRILTDQVPTKYRQVPTKLTDYVTEPEGRLIKAIGTNELSVKKLMDAIGLKQRRNFMVNYIEPSIKDGLVTLLYPESPRHPRQKYKLTVKGLAIFQELESD